jgi:hypothetical protein
MHNPSLTEKNFSLHLIISQSDVWCGALVEATSKFYVKEKKTLSRKEEY